MADGSWDNTGAPPEKKGMPLWAKISLGCGVAFLLVIAGCTLAVTYGCKHMMNKGWAQIRSGASELSTDDGARKMYRSNPGLAHRYATEEEFVKASSAWREKISQLPEKPPSLKEMAEGKGEVQFHTSYENGRERTLLKIRLQDGSHLTMESDDKGLTDIKVD